MTIRAGIRGDQFDLDTLAWHFPAPSDPAIGTDKHGHYLTSSTFPGDPRGDGNAIRAAVEELLPIVNGVGRVADPSFVPVELTGNFWDTSGSVMAVVVTDTLLIRAQISSGRPSPPTGDRLIRLAAQHVDVRDVLSLLAKPKTDWYDLWKIYEIVLTHVSPPAPGSGRIPPMKDLSGKGWCTHAELVDFAESANHQGASGPAARHARNARPAPANPITLAEGRAVMAKVINGWLAAMP